MFPFKYKCKICGNIQDEQQSPCEFVSICNKCGKVDIPLYSIDLFYIKPKGIVKLLKAELKRRDERAKVRVKLLWTDRTGNKIEISKCTRSHVQNIIKMVNKFI